MVARLLLYALVCTVLTMACDIGIFYAMPTHMEFDSENVCPPLSGGCTQRITNMNTGEVTYATFIRWPSFATEVHEYMHTKVDGDEVVPYTVGIGILILIACPVTMICMIGPLNEKQAE